MTTILSRRTVLAGALGAGVGATAVTLAGCSPTPPSTSAGSSADPRAALPDFRPAELVEPDLAGTDVVMSGYFTYPSSPRPVFAQPPAAGIDRLSILYPTLLPIPKSPETNSFWGRLQSDLGTKVQLQPVPTSDYNAKFQAVVAGGELPDVFVLPTTVPDLPRFLQQACADLTPLLGGTAATDFPYLANIPTASWHAAINGGRLWGVPQPRAITGTAIFRRTDLFDEAGVSPSPEDFGDLRAMMAGLTRPAQQRWAFSNPARVVELLNAMQGGPNQWSEKDGTFTSAYLDPRYREALARTAELVAAGFVHPAANTASANQHRDLFQSGATSMLFDGYAAWDLLVKNLGSSDRLDLLVAPRYDGGGDSPQLAGRSYQAVTVISRRITGERLRSVVNALNFLATPIGSAEHLHRKFGVEGQDFTVVDGRPQLTERGKSGAIDLQYIADAPTILGPGSRSDVERQHAWHRRVAANLIANPTVGLYSATASNRAAVIDRPLADTIKGVQFGRNSLSDFDAAVAAWRAAGGDTMAREYGESFAANR